jgi:hypothetical protein
MVGDLQDVDPTLVRAGDATREECGIHRLSRIARQQEPPVSKGDVENDAPVIRAIGRRGIRTRELRLGPPHADADPVERDAVAR